MKYIKPNSVFHQFARDYAGRGLAVFPLEERTKIPAIATGFKAATTDLEQIDCWWGSEPLKNSNIGIATGSPSKLAVLDVDAKPDAGEILSDLEAEFSKIDDAPVVCTGNHGYQFYFVCNDRLPSRIGIRRGVDFKCEGGYVVAPPSIHPNGRTYYWDIATKGRNPIPPLPAWLHKLVADEAAPASALKSEAWQKVFAEGVVEGRRNDTLTKLVGHLFRKYVDPGVTRELAHCWNEARCVPPMNKTEVERTLQSIARSEIRRRTLGGVA